MNSNLYSQPFRLLNFACITIFACIPTAFAEEKPNVLFIAIDDLRPELGCYGASHIVSPNIDAFANTARVFKRAYCQQSVCNPSRTSVMTGLRPDTIGVTSNHIHFRTKRPEAVTLPQHFKNHGYRSVAIGKIYHGVFPAGASKTKWDTMGDPPSWSEPALRFGPRYYYTEQGIAAAKESFVKSYQPKNGSSVGWDQKLVFGPASESPNVKDNVLYDGQVAEAAVKKLGELKESKDPFFLAVGFIKPHSPYVAPKKYFDLYTDVEIATKQDLPENAPRIAGHGSGELRRYTDQPKQGRFSEKIQKQVRHAYHACVSFVDAQVGRVLDQLKNLDLDKNTIVVIWGDHGYHLGEQGLWGKTTNFELDTRVPLIVRTPRMNARGESTDSIVELVDLYPTLCELAGLPIDKQLEGKSFGPILSNPKNETKEYAYSLFPRSGGIVGYSVRNRSHRLTKWLDQKTGHVSATELYEYSQGLVEIQNVAANYPDVANQLFLNLMAANPRIGDLTSLFDTNDGVGFESNKPGEFETIQTKLGIWEAVAGRVLVDNQHAKTGRQCLQIAGGEKSSVLLSIEESIDTTGSLTFWAERWTARKPFSFRIEKNSGEGWKEIYNGDAKVKVGRSFLNRVKVKLGDAKIKQLRFTVSSPPNTGILIDDIRIAPSQPQKIVDVQVVPMTVPALVGADFSRILHLQIKTEGEKDPISLSQIFGNIYGVDSLDSLHIVKAANSFHAQTLKRPENSADSTWKLTPIVLDEGENSIFIGGGIKNSADIDQKIGVRLTRISLSNGKTYSFDSEPSWQRLGVSVRNKLDDDVHTFRIPGLATTNKGTLIGVYDVRYRGGGDLPGDIDVGMSRSVDGGKTWKPMKVIMDMGRDPKWNYDGIGDPSILVDKKTGTIWVAATWSHGNRSWRGSGPGLKPEETGQFMLVKSDDDGVTWSKPINITDQIKKPEWCFILQGPGKGITMRDGTIVFPAQYQDPPNKNRLPHSTIIYSKDHGKTWKVGAGAFDDTTESQVIEVEPGVLMLNCRYNRKSARVVMTTRDMGKTWQKHSTSERSLIEPRACMASLIDVDQELGKDAGGWLLFSNPDSLSGRQRMMIKASRDGGKTWPKEFRLLLDQERSAGYSCMSMIDEKTVGILYEGSQAHMTFQRIPLEEILGGTNLGKSKRSEKKNGDEDLSQLKKESNRHSDAILSLPFHFSSNMVLQADKPIKVWGVANPGQMVSVQLGDEKSQVRANKNGRWLVALEARKANKSPQKMVVQAEDRKIEFDNILIGEVWICAGQSNMEWMLKQSTYGAAESQHLSKLKRDSIGIRLLDLTDGPRGTSGSYTDEHLARLSPASYASGNWVVADSRSASEFSAVAWYFGRSLQQKLDVPIGLICPAVGGSPTEAWIPFSALAGHEDHDKLTAGNWLDNPHLGEFCKQRGEQNLLKLIQDGHSMPGDACGPNHPFKPGFLWQATIKPLIPLGIRGVIWYQGESNAETEVRTQQHESLFPMLISEWRREWNQRDFPFLYVQLPAMNRPFWPEFRDGQRRVLSKLKNLGMAITIDTGLEKNVHPPHKKPIGKRLAKLANKLCYSHSGAVHSGPLFRFVQHQGSSIIVEFDQVGEGLKNTSVSPLQHFEICGEDGEFYLAKAKIVAANKVLVWSPEVKKPKAVRYAWLPFPKPTVSLFNSEGLPASPFVSE